MQLARLFFIMQIVVWMEPTTARSRPIGSHRLTQSWLPWTLCLKLAALPGDGDDEDDEEEEDYGDDDYDDGEDS